MGSSVFYPIHQNVLWTFLIALGLIHWNEKVKENKLWKRIIIGITTLAVAYIGGIITFVDYYNAGILMVLTFYFLEEKCGGIIILTRRVLALFRVFFAYLKAATAAMK
jgi:hypothetical protein